MRKQILTVLAICLMLCAAVLSGCKAANQVPGVSAARSAVGSAVASALPSLAPTATVMPSPTGATIMPSPSATAMATTTVK